MPCIDCVSREECRCKCARLEVQLPTTGNALSEKLIDPFDLAAMGEKAALSWPEMAPAIEPAPSTWPVNKRMAFDHFHNRLTVAECARRYQTKQRTVKARLARVCGEIMSASTCIRKTRFQGGR